MRHEHAGDKRAVLRLKNNDLGLLKKLRDFKMHLVLDDSAMCVNFDYTQITKEARDQFRLNNSCWKDQTWFHEELVPGVSKLSEKNEVD